MVEEIEEFVDLIGLLDNVSLMYQGKIIENRCLTLLITLANFALKCYVKKFFWQIFNHYYSVWKAKFLPILGFSWTLTQGKLKHRKQYSIKYHRIYFKKLPWCDMQKQCKIVWWFVPSSFSNQPVMRKVKKEINLHCAISGSCIYVRENFFLWEKMVKTVKLCSFSSFMFDLGWNE